MLGVHACALKKITAKRRHAGSDVKAMEQASSGIAALAIL